MNGCGYPRAGSFLWEKNPYLKWMMTGGTPKKLETTMCVCAKIAPKTSVARHDFDPIPVGSAGTPNWDPWNPLGPSTIPAAL